MITRAEISRRIAIFIEPEPFWCEFRYDGLHTKSRLGVWWTGNGYVQEAADMYAPDMLIRLIERMPEPELWLESSPDETRKLYGCTANMSAEFGARFAETIAESVVHTFCLHYNLATPEELS